MSNDDDFAIIHGKSSQVGSEELRSFEWEDIISQINDGKVNNKIIWIMQTQDIPSKYDEAKLREKFMENYNKYLESLVHDAAKKTK